MKQAKIESTLRRVNHKLAQSMDSTEKQEVIQQFKALYSRIHRIKQEQMKSLSLKISKVQKVTQNLKEKQVEQDKVKNQIKDRLNSRMEMHFKKRESYQQSKLNNFKRMELRWKDKLKAIGEQIKERKQQSILLSNRLSKEAALFLQSKQQRAKSRLKMRKASQRFKSQQSPIQHYQTHFLTQADLSPKGQQQQRFNFPNIKKDHSRIKTEGYKSLGAQKSQSIKDHLIRSFQFWKTKEDDNFQKVMKKMEHIEVTRNKVKEQLSQAANAVKQSRINRDQYYRENRLKKDDNQSSNTRSVQLQQREQGRSRLEMRRDYNSSKVQKRRIQLHEQQFQRRGKHFQMVLLKDRKRGYRKMVREGVNLLKLQALKRN